LAGFVLLKYNAVLAVLVLGFGAVMCVVSVLLASSGARAQQRVDVATGGVNGFLFQVLAAIPKIRVAGAEPRAFLAWARRFAPAGPAAASPRSCGCCSGSRSPSGAR